jgi:hypothetical protein
MRNVVFEKISSLQFDCDTEALSVDASAILSERPAGRASILHGSVELRASGKKGRNHDLQIILGDYRDCGHDAWRDGSSAHSRSGAKR